MDWDLGMSFAIETVFFFLSISIYFDIIIELQVD